MAAADHIDLAVLFARQYGAGGFVFWTADDWDNAYAVQAWRNESNTVTIRCLNVGTARLSPP